MTGGYTETIVQDASFICIYEIWSIRVQYTNNLKKYDIIYLRFSRLIILRKVECL